MRRDFSKVVIHHSASPPRTTRATIRKWHVERNGWADIGYHHICLADGRIVPGRPFSQRGAHSGSAGNAFTGICVTGYNGDEIERWRSFTDRGGNKRRKKFMAPNPGWQWTDAQIKAVQNYLDGYRLIFPGATFCGHRDLKPTLCPGLDVRELFN